MEKMIEFLKTLDKQTATVIQPEYIAISVGASRNGFVELDVNGDDILAKLTEKGAAIMNNEFEYPTIVEHRLTGAVVLASAPRCGTVLVSNDSTTPMGLFRMDWTDFSNDKIWERLQTGDIVTLTQV